MTPEASSVQLSDLPQKVLDALQTAHGPVPTTVDLPSDLAPIDIRQLQVGPRVRRLLTTGYRAGEFASRSEAMHFVMCEMLRGGHPDVEIARAVFHAKSSIGDLAGQKGMNWLADDLARAKVRVQQAKDDLDALFAKRAAMGAAPIQTTQMANAPTQKVVTFAPLPHPTPVSIQPPAYVQDLPASDLGNAERFRAHWGADVRYCAPIGKFFTYDGYRFNSEGDAGVYQRAKLTVRTIYDEAPANSNSAIRTQLARWAAQSESRSRIDAMIALAQREAGIAAIPSDFDHDPWLLNVISGTFNLRTGTLQFHNRADLITKLAPVRVDPQAKAPRFEAFLDRIFEGDPALISYVQRAFGYAITGFSSERKLIVFNGSGRNGKSTLVNLVMAVLGDYAQRLPNESLLVHRQGSIPNDIARLKGVRIAVASETREGDRLDDARVKILASNDPITARFLHGEFFDFYPMHTLFLMTNYLPSARGDDHALWDRIHVVPFEVRIGDDELDRSLFQKLLDEASGILNWLIQGCQEWQRIGLAPPSAVVGATAAYRGQSDIVGRFLRERCEVRISSRVGASELFAAFERWCEMEDEKPWSQKAFGKRLRYTGEFEHKRSGPNGAYEWYGLQLADPDESTKPLPTEPSISPLNFTEPSFTNSPMKNKEKETLEKVQNHSEKPAWLSESPFLKEQDQASNQEFIGAPAYAGRPSCNWQELPNGIPIDHPGFVVHVPLQGGKQYVRWLDAPPLTVNSLDACPELPSQSIAKAQTNAAADDRFDTRPVDAGHAECRESEPLLKGDWVWIADSEGVRTYAYPVQIVDFKQYENTGESFAQFAPNAEHEFEYYAPVRWLEKANPADLDLFQRPPASTRGVA